MSSSSSRLAGENSARLTLVQLLCAWSFWRTAMTRVLPLCGASAWWVTLYCLLPGFLFAALLRWVMRLTGAKTLTEAVRACLGQAGAAVLSAVLALLLLAEGAASMTALTNLFTQGVGTRGTAFTLAALTGGALLLALHREGLPRAAYLLRWPVVATAVIIAACLLPDARLDHLYPLHGEGDTSVFSAIKAGVSLGWPIALLLTAEPARQGRLRTSVRPALAAVTALFVLALTVPQELLSNADGLAMLLLLPAKYASNALRILYLCLLMLAIFLSISASVQLATECICAPMKKNPVWLPYVILAGLILTQIGDTARLWDNLGELEPWMLLPLAVLALLCLIRALLRRKCA